MKSKRKRPQAGKSAQARKRPKRGKLFRRAVIIGVGLIGGSVGMGIRKYGLSGEVVGIGPDSRALKKAVLRRAIHRGEAKPAKFPEVFENADLVILATPVGQMEAVAGSIAPYLSETAVVTDVGSVKGAMVGRLGAALSPHPYIGAHPIAGREQSGVDAAAADLFKGATCILTPVAGTSPRGIRTVEKLWRGLGARPVHMAPDVHDWILGITSHLPHLTAYALVNTVLEMQSSQGDLLNFSAGGLRDFTRVAASSPEMWRDICMANRDGLVPAIEAYENVLSRFRAMLHQGDSAGLLREFKKAQGGKFSLDSGTRKKKKMKTRK
ncbi:MAG TPA: prephenate dehydrogenase/arogenate dehydrogenase family protein [Nitrospiria bacterium]|nr:prephenate dehydrogenase/arogenate dehydrogenase family protein [Nitrospiria bacterium]